MVVKALSHARASGNLPLGTEPEHFRWEVSGKPVVIHLDQDVVDRLLKEAMRGFGAIPRRSLEVGGILLGSVDQDSTGRWIVSVQDFEPVPCRHSRGAGYTLSAEELTRFGDALALWQPGGGRHLQAVGFYRSHSREGLGLSAEDRALFDRYFSQAPDIALLVKPYATRASTGAFFIREQSTVKDDSSYLEFPLRRREHAEDRAREAAMKSGDENRESKMRQTGEFHIPAVPAAMMTSTRPGGMESRLGLADSSRLTGVPEEESSSGGGKHVKWVWIPLSFIFLLLGVTLGFYVASNLGTSVQVSRPPVGFALNLTASPSGSSVHVRWDRTTGPVLASTKGKLFIDDDGRQKTVDLDAALLQNGSILYNRAGQNLKFRLEVYAQERVTVSETLELHLDSPAPSR